MNPPMENQNLTFNYMSAAEMDELLEKREQRGFQRGYEQAKREEERPIDAKEAAAYLGVTISTIRNWTSNKTIKHHKKGGRTYYYRSELKP
jgi:excisionase family DNA binding protein